jgi:hypothetical protein
MGQVESPVFKRAFHHVQDKHLVVNDQMLGISSKVLSPNIAFLLARLSRSAGRFVPRKACKCVLNGATCGKLSSADSLNAEP